MIKIERSVQLNWTLSSTAFEDINKDSFINDSRPLGSSLRAVNSMVAADEEMRFLLPPILGISPETKDVNWLEAVSNYWHNFGMEVNMGGKKFNTSLIFDLSDYTRRYYIEDILKNYIKTTKPSGVDGAPDIELTFSEKEQAFAKYVMDNYKEVDLYRYCKPENVTDYLAWRFCLLSSIVGNSPAEMVKEGKGDELRSTHIKFYMTDEAEIARKKQAYQKVRDKAIMNYSKVLGYKDQEVDTLLVALDLVSSMTELKELELTDKRALLYDASQNSAEKFNATFASKSLNDVAEIKKLLMAGLIRNIPNSTIYTDADTPSQVLGNTFDEVITYFANDLNKAYANDLRLKLKSYMK